MKATKTLGMMVLMLCALFVAIVGVHADYDTAMNVVIDEVKIDGTLLSTSQVYKTEIERDSEIPVTVKVLQTNSALTAQNVRVEVSIWSGKDMVDEISEPFDLANNTAKTLKFNLALTPRVDSTQYQLRVTVTNANGQDITENYPISVASLDHSIAIKEVTFSPNDKVMAGRAFTAVARLKNYGQKTEEDVKVMVAIPELGVQAVDYVSKIAEDKTVSTEEMLIRIPANTKSGTYDVEVTAYYDDYDEKTKAVYSITIEGDSNAAQATQSATGAVSLSGKTVITAGPQAQTVARGESGIVYPITIANGENTARTYTLVTSGTQDWATVKMSPSNVVVLNPGETKQAYVYIAASENAAVGEHVFSVDVKSGNVVLQQVVLKADVLESSSATAWDGVKKALQVGIIALVVLIVILGAVIVYQKKFKPSESKDEAVEEIAQTYY